MKVKQQSLFILSLLLLSVLPTIQAKSKGHDVQVLIVSTSKFWFNFRQATNVLLIYEILKKNGVKDENILMMIPETAACNPRNNNPGVVCPLDTEVEPNLYRGAEIDYRLHDVTLLTVENIIRGRYNKYTPRSRRLVTNKNTKMMTYFTGHGGDGYIKIQDTHVMMDDELKILMEEAHQKNIYNEALMISDSCGASTVFEKLTSPNIFAIGSSSRTEKSYSHGHDAFLGLSVVDRFTRISHSFITQNIDRNKYLSVQDVSREWTPDLLNGHFNTVNTHPKKKDKGILIKDYFTNQNPKKADLINFSKENSHTIRLESILDEIQSLPKVDLKISNRSYQ